jgi:Na+(H+)/acetate symporter ActP
MGEPYGRIMLMHLTIIFGGWIAMAFDNVLPALMLLIGLKIAVDVSAHLKQHKPKSAKETRPS